MVPKNKNNNTIKYVGPTHHSVHTIAISSRFLFALNRFSFVSILEFIHCDIFSNDVNLSNSSKKV